MIERSFIIAVYYPPSESDRSIDTLLSDLEDISGEVICIFNSRKAHEEISGHPRIGKWCHNSRNLGVPRSWNMGLQLAEGKTVFIMDDDLRVGSSAIIQLEEYLYNLPGALIVGPTGSLIDHGRCELIHFLGRGKFHKPLPVHEVSGFFQAINLNLFRKHKLAYDVELSPAFFEERDLGLHVLNAGLCPYAVPVTDYAHDFRMSVAGMDFTASNWKANKQQVLDANRKYLINKWQPHIIAQCIRKFEKWQSRETK
jgi:GT2 family glycosyltransferase